MGIYTTGKNKRDTTKFHSKMHIVKGKPGASTCKDPYIYEEYDARLSSSHTHPLSLDTIRSIISYSTQTFIDAIISNASTSAWTTFHESTHRIRLACKCNHKNDTFSAQRLLRFCTILSPALSLEYQLCVWFDPFAMLM